MAGPLEFSRKPSALAFMARLPQRNSALPVRLDSWLKGPVYYGADVTLRAEVSSAATTFALHVDGDERPAILGRLCG